MVPAVKHIALHMPPHLPMPCYCPGEAYDVLFDCIVVGLSHIAEPGCTGNP